MSNELKAELIAPFIKATISVFESMMGLKVHRKNVYLKNGYVMFGEISGIIGMSGDTTGTCAISLPTDLALRAISLMLCEPVEGGLTNPIVRDGVGELINMITGQAKAILANSSYRFDITLPTLISGTGHEIFHRAGTHCIVVLFETDAGEPFTLDVCIRSRK